MEHTHESDVRAADDRTRDLHTRLLVGDPTAPSDLAVALLDPLVDWFGRAFHIVAFQHLTRPLLVAIDPSPAQLRLVD